MDITSEKQDLQSIPLQRKYTEAEDEERSSRHPETRVEEHVTTDTPPSF